MTLEIEKLPKKVMQHVAVLKFNGRYLTDLTKEMAVKYLNKNVFPHYDPYAEASGTKTHKIQKHKNGIVFEAQTTYVRPKFDLLGKIDI